MDLSEMQTRVAELEQQISALPAGSVTKKTVNGKEYFYHRWTENKKRREKYIPADELENFRAQIERRKALEQELKALKKQLPKAKSTNPAAFTTNVRTGETLRSFAASVRGYRRRECFRQLHDFVCGEPQDKVFILYGLRRTGKTTMIRQIFAEMSDTELAKSAFIQITAKDSLADVNRDLKALETKLANPKKQVFVLQFPVGEFDMVVFDPEAGSCRIFEIKHSEEAVPQQYRHLIDEQKCVQTEHRYGTITGKFVLYRGESQEIDGIQYQNVEEYLRSLA